MNGRIEFDLPAEQYHQKQLGMVSKSALDRLHPTPAHYYAWAMQEGGGESTAALEFGKAGHCAIFEPEVFADDYVIEPDFGDCRYKENKAKRDKWRAENLGKSSLSAKEHEKLLCIQSSVRQHKLIDRLFSKGRSEVTLFWEDEETGLSCKARADRYVEELATAVDLKLVADASPEGFAKSVAKWRYHVQEAHYSEGFAAAGKPLKHFVFVAIEKAEPFASAVYSLDLDAKNKGHELLRADIETMARCVNSNAWPGYPLGINELSLPKWAL